MPLKFAKGAFLGKHIVLCIRTAIVNIPHFPVLDACNSCTISFLKLVVIFNFET